MPDFHYIARDIDGAEHAGVVKSRDPETAAEKLRRKGLFPSEVKGVELKLPAAEKKRSPLDIEIPLPAFLRVVNTKHLMILTRQLATLVHAGLPLLRSLNTLERQQSNAAARKTLHGVAASIEGGSTFADALAEHPRVFNRFYVNMVKAGEAGGMLDTTLDRLAGRMEKALRIKTRIQTAMTYPAVVLFASAAILVFMMIAIIPRFEEIFADLLEGRSLPTLTLYVMGVSENLQTHWPLWIGAGIVLWALTALLKQFRRGRAALDRLKLSTPYFGGLTRLAALGRFARSLGTLMEAGVPVLRALEITRETLNNEILIAAVNQIHDAVRDGQSMAEPVEANRIFPPVFGSMVEVGEETGDLPGMLLKTADLYEEEVDGAVAAMSSIIEPAMIVVLALVVGTIVIAMFLPMVSIIGNLS